MSVSSCTTCTLGLSFKWFFLVLHPNSAVVIILKIIPNLYGVYSKIDAPPSFRTRRYFSHHLVRGNSLQDYPLFAGETVGTRIDRDISLIMPLRLRGGYATECHAFSYYTSSSAFAFSPPCGSCSVFEVAHTVYKNALNECSFGCGCPIRNCNKVAISLAQSANITVAIGNNIMHALRVYHFHRLAARTLNRHIPCIRTL